jgi:membrane protein DedA with SNARE-associated domain
MTDLIQFILRHGYVVLFGAVFVEQIGVPVPSAPVLMAAGALSAGGNLNLPLVLLFGVLAALPGDLIWYQLGRIQGHKVFSLICRPAPEPDSCVRRTEDTFVRHGPLLGGFEGWRSRGLPLQFDTAGNGTLEGAAKPCRHVS